MRPALALQMSTLVAGGVALLCGAPASAAVGPVGQLSTVDCTGIAGWAHDPDLPADIIDVHLYFGGPAGDPAASAIAITADIPLPAGCDPLTCDHGFVSGLPMSLLDDAEHAVHAYGIDLTADPNLQIELSPALFSCPPPPVVGGEKRHVTSPEILAAWGFSVFFDRLVVDDALLAGLPEAGAIATGPVLAVGDGADTTVWLLDGEFRRFVDPEYAEAWRLDLAAAVITPAADLAAMPEGAPLRPRPILLQGTEPAVYLLDDHNCVVGDPDPVCDPEPPDPGGSGGGDTTGDGGSDGGTSGTSAAGSEGGDGSSAAVGTGDATDAGPSSGLPAPDLREGGDSGCSCRAHGRDHAPSWVRSWVWGMLGVWMWSWARRRG